MLTMLVCAAAMAQSTTGGIKGKIVSRSGRIPIAEARLTLTDAEGTAVKLNSDQNGDFVFNDLENGSYTILVEASMWLWTGSCATLCSSPCSLSRCSPK